MTPFFLVLKLHLTQTKNYSDKTQPCGTPLLIDRGGETYPSTTTGKDLSERQLIRREQLDGEKPKEGSFENNDL